MHSKIVMRCWQSFAFLICVFLLLSACDPNNNKKRYATRHTYPRELRLYYPYITGDLFRHFSHHIVDDTHIPFYPKEVKRGDVVFLKTKYLKTFHKYMHPAIRAPYILITGNGDEEAPGEYAALLEDEKIIAWFAMNATLSHPKLIPIPIGGGKEEMEELLQQPIQKERLLYLNFQELNHPERVFVKNYFSKLPFCTIGERMPFLDYLRAVRSSKFHISPRGNGIDCHRVWESILAGSIPILKSSPLDPLYQDLPVLIVQEWSEVTEELLEQKYAEISNKKYNLEKLYIDYWLCLIDSFTPGNYFKQEKLMFITQNQSIKK